MQSVDSSKYDRDYFTNKIGTKLNECTSSDGIYKIMLDMLSLKKEDKIIDFGCGSGLFTFLLNKHHKCEVIGIDYSEDAIKLCNEYKQVLQQDKVSFIHSNIENLPPINNVAAVYLTDVIEHLYDEEIKMFLQKIINWKIDSKPLHLIVHTDNLLFLKYIRWIIDLFSLLTLNKTFGDIKARNIFEKERHVNLMTLKQLNKKMKKQGYTFKQVTYPTLDDKKMESQFGKLSKIPFFYFFVKKFYPWIKWLAPSFYVLYSYD